ncbi:MAG TPA: helix-turn-helix domain-containing protein, partial [Herpetosiphonaceae bacterium]|nr:helix-turn-helix domain-containing protein [Herpetosiphonaceae bacterium]
MRAPSPHLDHIADFGSLLRYLRRRARLTQRDLAIATGYSESQICRLEQNTRTADLSALMALFVPALAIDDQPDLIARLIELATLARENEPGGQVGATTRTVTASSARIAVDGGPAPRGFPAPATRLLGRERDLAGVCAELARDEVRLLTITGAPGIGKTALGLRAAAELGQRFAAGAAVVDLAAVNEAGLVAATIAQALRLRDHGQQDAAAALAAELRDTELLLVLDNCEHLREAAPLIAWLLGATSQLKILATSRAPLRIALEHEWPLPPLELPAESEQAPERLAGVPAVALFLARARAADPAFGLSAANAAAIASICRQLDGVPLALELAAAWSKALTPHKIAARLGQPFAFLTRRPQDWPARHQTLWEAISWSYDLLDGRSRRLLQRLSVFPAAFGLEAAAAVGSAEGDDQLAVLEGLAGLVDQSLI